MEKPADYVILEWLDIDWLDCASQYPRQYPRYSFATTVHAAELGAAVRWVEPCASVDAAASLVARLNAGAWCGRA